MTVKEIFIKKLLNAKYKNKTAFDYWEATSDFNGFLKILEDDKDNVFRAMYGEKNIQDRGVKPMKEYMYRLLEAERDLRSNYITMTMHYLIMQIRISQLKI